MLFKILFLHVCACHALLGLTFSTEKYQYLKSGCLQAYGNLQRYIYKNDKSQTHPRNTFYPRPVWGKSL